MTKYKYSKLAKLLMPKASWEDLITYQENYDLCTGKSTALLLEAISKAMLNPNTEFTIWPYNGDLKYSAAGGLGSTLDYLIDKLELKFLVHNKTRGTLKYNPYGYVTKSWVEIE